ncbi:MAG: TIGR00282 family metallophosphoesterase [Candidatus Omnitrophica bacterium CG07_land_8_20_14_0_80_50_8]|nr:MAG: metallophosphoesterase [Candidatus Omnitrophica bacterium CG1_02_49_16]PIU39930.1 MAG: TIGR00282 family metallophosphoesterase [Candidatus Omnitrophica bacterium CG07_land_8_20_14_0_80_50_8]
MLKILVIGDVYGEPGRKAVERFVRSMKSTGEADFVVCNAENAAGGAGITESAAKELFINGCDVLTGGDHFFDKKKEIEEYLKKEFRVIRPANFPKGLPGEGSCVVEHRGTKIGVLHVAGQVFMRHHFNSPFLAADEEIDKVKKQGAQVVIVDIHAEATSEKTALCWYLDGQVSAVVGTHTHVQTADERVTQKGTACITDLGLTGPYDSVIGAEKGPIIEKFLTQLNLRKEVAKNDVRLSGVILTVDERSGKALKIERVQKKLTV